MRAIAKHLMRGVLLGKGKYNELPKTRFGQRNSQDAIKKGCELMRYVAVFRNHRIERNSHREYKFAWIVTKGEGRKSILYKGFSSTKALAHKAAQATMPKAITVKDRRLLKSTHIYLAKRDGLSLADWYVAHESWRVQEIESRRVEVAEVEIV
jgi:hypothetical protein